MRGHDAHLAGYRKRPVAITCRDCGRAWDGDQIKEYGTAWLEPREDCLSCGSTELDVSELSDEDIAERRYEARGEL